MKLKGRPVHRAISSLGHDSRFQLALLLLECPACVSDLAKRVGLSQSCTTRHLQALQRAGVVRGTRDGKRVVFRTVTDRDEIAALLALLTPEGASERTAPALGPRRSPSVGGAPRSARRDPPNTITPRPAPQVPAPAALEPDRRVATPSRAGLEPASAHDEAALEMPPEAPEDAPSQPLYRRRPEIEDYLL